ncbi:cytochrome P450 [Methylococcus sp. EFPC2]|uniref:cytochrome P450 n=1 Tax=Methylococcus sp. EFPC2 TaxID=2812648 RepID=UPI001966DF57|nr:cytochrome P450 [Methylococcus sp. EFPC2]QSA98762.1 cytochrome P450 [Methylococcus sp. EFPC2]
MPSLPAPVPPGLPLLGNLLEFRAGAYQAMQNWHKRHGDLVHFRLGPRSFYLASHPDLVEEILIARPEQFVKMYTPAQPRGLALVLGQGLVTSTGALWKRQRRLIQPLFVRSRVTEYADEIVAAGRVLLQRWQALAPAASLDIGAEMMSTTLEVITRTMFNASVQDHLERLAPAFSTVLQYAADDVRLPLRIPQWLPTPRNRAFRYAMGVLDGLVYELIEERRRAGTPRDDLLDRLMRARDEETGEPMSDEQIRDEVLTIFAAGHETTAVTLTWVCYLLAAHPQVAARLEAEVDEVLGNREPTLDDIPRLIWTRAVVDEAMRLYPPAAVLIRKNTGETSLGGYRIRKDGLVIVNVANIHRHPGFWEMPDAFSPERFLADAAKPAHRLAYMPFGAGHRVCIGNAFALTESVLLLAMMARHHRFDLAPGQSVDPEIEVTLRPRGGLRLTVSKR